MSVDQVLVFLANNIVFQLEKEKDDNYNTVKEGQTSNNQDIQSIHQVSIITYYAHRRDPFRPKLAPRLRKS